MSAVGDDYSLRRLFSFLSLKRKSAQDKLSSAARRVELHRRELDVLRSKLEARRQVLFEMIVRCVKKKDDRTASVYSSEHAEIKKVIQVVSASEIALTQVALRFESIRDVGQAISHVNSVSKVLKEVGYDMSVLGPSLEHATEEVNAVLGDTLAELGNLSSSVHLDAETLSVEQIIAKAKSFAEQKATELKDSLASEMDRDEAQDVLKQARQVALLANGTEVPVPYQKLNSYSPHPGRRINENVQRYLISEAGRDDAVDVCSALGITKDEFEEAVLSLASKGNRRLPVEV